TTTPGAQRIHNSGFPDSVLVTPVSDKATISPGAIVAAIRQVQPGNLLLVEGGPHLIGEFFAERCLDDLFLTIAPQVAGRDDSANRPGLVTAHLFAPDDPRWGTLVSVKRGMSHLFLRYAFDVPSTELR